MITALGTGEKEKVKECFTGTESYINVLGLKGRKKALTSLYKNASSILQKCSARAMQGSV